MDKKKLNNLIDYNDFSKEITKKSKPTKRTSVAKDVLNEHHKENRQEQEMWINDVLDKLSDEDIEKVYWTMEEMIESGDIGYEELLNESLIGDLVDKLMNKWFDVEKDVYKPIADRTKAILKKQGVNDKSEIESIVKKVVDEAKKHKSEGNVFLVDDEVKFIPKKEYKKYGISTKSADTALTASLGSS